MTVIQIELGRHFLAYGVLLVSIWEDCEDFERYLCGVGCGPEVRPVEVAAGRGAVPSTATGQTSGYSWAWSRTGRCYVQQAQRQGDAGAWRVRRRESRVRTPVAASHLGLPSPARPLLSYFFSFFRS